MSGENRTELAAIRHNDMDVGWYHCPYIPINMPIIRNVLPELTAADIVGVQPMVEPETVVETFRIPIEIANALEKEYGLDLEQVLVDALKKAIAEEMGGTEVICDETNNSPEDIAQGKLNVDLRYKWIPSPAPEEPALDESFNLATFEDRGELTELSADKVAYNQSAQPLRPLTSHIDIASLQGFDSGVQSYCPTLQGSLNDPSDLSRRRRGT